MFKEKNLLTKTNNEDVIINLVLIITTKNKLLKRFTTFKEKEPRKTKTIIDWNEEEKL
jgi:hypothetical protein